MQMVVGIYPGGRRFSFTRDGAVGEKASTYLVGPSEPGMEIGIAAWSCEFHVNRLSARCRGYDPLDAAGAAVALLQGLQIGWIRRAPPCAETLVSLSFDLFFPFRSWFIHDYVRCL